MSITRVVPERIIPPRTLESGADGDRVNEQVGKSGVGGTVEVDALDCVKKSDSEGRCFATVSGAASGRQGITVTFGKDSDYLWEADDPSTLDLGAATAAQTSIWPSSLSKRTAVSRPIAARRLGSRRSGS